MVAQRLDVLAVVGATATGKTDLGEMLAERLDGEVVCADSRQVFRELEIGTGKPSPEARSARRHHLFDRLPLGERASAGWYARACAEVRREIRARGRLPILVGGSGLYLKSAQRGLFSEPPHDPDLRDRLRRELEACGPQEMHRRLAAVDAPSAARIGAADRQRIVRALEVFEASGRSLSWWHANAHPQPSNEEWRVIELVLPASTLAGRIETRTRVLFETGLIEETRDLLAAGQGNALRALRAVGYEQAIGWIEGRWDRAEAERLTSLRTRQLAKRQRTWFRHQTIGPRIDAQEAGPALAERALASIDSPGGRG